jgi:hypothetical protein
VQEKIWKIAGGVREILIHIFTLKRTTVNAITNTVTLDMALDAHGLVKELADISHVMTVVRLGTGLITSRAHRMKLIGMKNLNGLSMSGGYR